MTGVKTCGILHVYSFKITEDGIHLQGIYSVLLLYFFSFMITTAINPYKIETLSILLIKLLSLLKKTALITFNSNRLFLFPVVLK